MIPPQVQPNQLQQQSVSPQSMDMVQQILQMLMAGGMGQPQAQSMAQGMTKPSPDAMQRRLMMQGAPSGPAGR